MPQLLKDSVKIKKENGSFRNHILLIHNRVLGDNRALGNKKTDFLKLKKKKKTKKESD